MWYDDEPRFRPGQIVFFVACGLFGWFSVKWGVDLWGIKGAVILVAAEMAIAVVLAVIFNSRRQKRQIEEQQRSSR